MGTRLITILMVVSALTALQSVASPSGRVSLAWDPSPDAAEPGRIAGYILYYSTQIFTKAHPTNDDSMLIQSFAVGDQTTATLTNLSPVQTYYFGVAAFDTNGVESELSNIAIFTTSSPLPPRCSTNLDGSVDVSWDARTGDGGSTAVVGYNLYFSTQRFDVHALEVPNPTGLTLISAGSHTNITLTSLPRGQTYYFAVASHGITGLVVDLSNVAELTLPSPPPPNWTINADASVSMTWDPRPDFGDSSKIAGYKVYYSTQPFDSHALDIRGTPQPAFISIGNEANLTLTNLNSGQTYYVAVASYDSDGKVSNLSNVTALTVPSPPPPTCVLGAENEVSVTWDVRSNFGHAGKIAGYNLYYSLLPFGSSSLQTAGSGVLQLLTVGTNTSAIVSGLAPGETYYFGVASFGSNGVVSDLSNLAVFTTPSAPAPICSPNPNGSVSIFWKSWSDGEVNGNIAGYNIYYSTSPFALDVLYDPDLSFFSVFSVGMQTNLVVTNLSPGQTYYFGVAARDINGIANSLSELAVFTSPLPELPAPPTLLAITLSSARDAIQATWNPSPDALIPGKIAGYKLYFGAALIPIQFLTIDHGTYAALSNLVTGETYFFGVSAYEADGTESAISNTVTFTIPALSIPEQMDLLGVLPSLQVTNSNELPALTIRGPMGANMLLQSNTNPFNPSLWTSISNLVLTNLLTNLSESRDAPASLLSQIFKPAFEVLIDSPRAEEPSKFYRVLMTDSYPMVGARALQKMGYHPQMIEVRLADDTVIPVCYVAEKNGYIAYDEQAHLAKLQPSGQTIREIATQVAGFRNQDWSFASEYILSGDLKVWVATVNQADPPSSDSDLRH